MSSTDDGAMRVLMEATAAVQRGWRVTPLKGKAAFVPGWQRGTEYTRWELSHWAYASHNFGVVTGKPSQLLVLDYDPRNDDGTPLPALPETVTAITGGGGKHFYFHLPKARITNSVRKLHPAIDVKTTGGQVVLAGSVHPDTGRPYRWADGLGPDDVSITALPLPIIERLVELSADSGARTKRKGRSCSAGQYSDEATHTPTDAQGVEQAKVYLQDVEPAVAHQDGHNHTYRVACEVVLGFDLSPDDAYIAMTPWNKSCRPPWSAKELAHKVKDADAVDDPRGFLRHDATLDAFQPWARGAIEAVRPERIRLIRRVRSWAIQLLNSGTHSRFVKDDDLDVGRAAYSVALSLLGAGYSKSEAMRILIASALLPRVDGARCNPVGWLQLRVQAAARYLARQPKTAGISPV